MAVPSYTAGSLGGFVNELLFINSQTDVGKSVLGLGLVAERHVPRQCRSQYLVLVTSSVR
jgi:hypothetical protein